MKLAKRLSKMNGFYKRIALGKTVGVVVGIITVIYLTYFNLTSISFQIGLLFWFTITGALVGVFGVMDVHPLFKWRMNWFIRGGLLGAMMFLPLALIGYDTIQMISADIYTPWFQSPYWVLIDGAIFGIIIDYFATKHYGEGKKLLK